MPLIGTADLLRPHWSGGLIENTAFAPSAEASAAHAPFFGTLTLTECDMTTRPSILTSRSVLGSNPKLFPGVALAFFTHDGDWSRAAFPFALVNSIEGETHNGVATFLYRSGRVSNQYGATTGAIMSKIHDESTTDCSPSKRCFSNARRS